MQDKYMLQFGKYHIGESYIFILHLKHSLNKIFRPTADMVAILQNDVNDALSSLNPRV